MELMTVCLQTVCAVTVVVVCLPHANTKGSATVLYLMYIPLFVVGHGPRKKKFGPISGVPWVPPVPSSIAVSCFSNTLELLPSGQTLK